jgi:ribulose-phosphate 3-epimerase
MKAGVALNPHTPVEALQPVLSEIDLICLMSVNPGFGGQHFIPQSLEKIASLKKMIRAGKHQVLIEVDGGVTLENAASIVQAGADVLVAGNAVFGANSPQEAIAALKKA